MVIDAFAAVRGLQPQKMSTVAILLGTGIIRIYFEQRTLKTVIHCTVEARYLLYNHDIRKPQDFSINWTSLKNLQNKQCERACNYTTPWPSNS